MRAIPTNRLRVLRAERDLAQEELAYCVEMKPSRYWRIEKGLIDPTSKEIRALARALKVPADALGLRPAEAVSA